MVSLSLARKLKKAGVVWTPRPNDFFAIPERGLDDRIFVISEIMTNIETIRGHPMVSFHGSAEWATDYLVTSEVVWLPRESQIRRLLLEVLAGLLGGFESPHMLGVEINLSTSAEISSCSIEIGEEKHKFSAQRAADAYALAYLHLSKLDLQ